MSNKKWLGILMAIIGAIFWGASGSVAELMFNTNNISPLWVVSIRLLSSGILLLISYLVINRKSIFSIWHDNKFRIQLIMFSFLGMMPLQLLYFLAIKFGNASSATVLSCTTPVFIIIFIAIKKHKLPSKMELLSVAFAVFGTFLLATRGSINSLSISLLGIVFGLGAGLANAIYTWMPVNLLKHYDAKLICGWGMVIGSIPLLPVIIVVQPPKINIMLIMELIFIIIIGTTLAFLFYVLSLNYVSVTVTSVLGSFEPLTATFLSFLFLNLHLNFSEFVGIALILIMTVMQSMKFNLTNIMDKLTKVYSQLINYKK